MTVPEPAYLELLEKYREMRRMRLEHAAGQDADARERMRALAARFPGALREIDTLPMEVIDARIADLARGRRPRWASILVAYHGWMRVALAVRRVHGRGSELRAVREWLRSTYRPRPGDPALEQLDDGALDAILRPPRGRISVWVVERIADDLGVSRSEVEGCLAGPGR